MHHIKICAVHSPSYFHVREREIVENSIDFEPDADRG